MNILLESILFSFFFFLPAGFANMAPVFVAKIPILKNFSFPIDFYQKINDRRLLGNHKTIRGFIAGILLGIIVCYTEQYLYTKSVFIQQISFTDYKELNPLILGFLLGFGALFGDAVKSFFKRQLYIKSGNSWFPFDQIDYILGGILFSLLYIQLPLLLYIYTFFIFFLLHILVSFCGYILHLKEKLI